MCLPLISFLAIFLIGAAPPVTPSPTPVHARLMMAAREGQDFDAHAEKELLDLANRAREQAGIAPFHVDDGLIRAAHKHAVAMADRQELSHQFDGEPALSQRLAATSSLYLVEAAENVASAESADRAHAALMHSVHHRENLLHPSYNVVGIAVLRRGDTLYVVQDFGDSYEKVSNTESDAQIAASVKGIRAQSKQFVLEQRESPIAHKEACEMAATDSLKTPQSAFSTGPKHLIRYTTLQPGILPDSANQAIRESSLKAYTVGSCFSRSKSYPTGIYWVVLVLY
jgi:uncharacterized protein YkwD